MPKPKNSLIAGLKKFGRALSPRKRSKSQGQQSGGSSPGASPGASPSASASQLSTTQVVANNSGSTNASNSSSGLAQAQITGQLIPTSQQSTAAGNLGVLPVISISPAPPPGSVATSGNQSQAPPTNNSAIINPALKEAIEQYANDLSDDDRKAFLGAKDIMLVMETKNKEHASQSISRSVGTRVEKVLLCMRSFVSSVSICIQHHPDISSLVLGGFNCVLTLALGYIEFFEKLTNMMDRIGGHLRYLEKYGSPIFQNSFDVQNTLKEAYCDLLDFLVAVRKIFTEKNEKGSYLSSVWLFMKINWESFEYKFQPIEERFAHHALVIVRSAGVEALITNLEAASAKQQEEKDKKRRQVLKWLSDIEYEKTQRRYFMKHLKGTGQWLLDDPLFLNWQNSQDTSILWCHGGPGAGKTILASLVTETLSKTSPSGSDLALCYLFCNYKEAVEPETYVGTLIKQLCRKIKVLPFELVDLYDKHFNDDTEPSMAELQDIFILIANQFRQTFLVIDALDECPAQQRNGLYGFLRHLSSSTGQSQGAIKVFITSRMEEDIRRALSNFPIVPIEARKVNEDIRSYVEDQLAQRLLDGRLRLKDLSLKDRIVTALVDRAGGMFLWVEFQLHHICSQTSDHHIQAALNDLPEGMDETYDRILTLIGKKHKAEKRLARRVLMWIAYTTEPLDVYDLRSFVAMEGTTRSHKDLVSMMPDEETVLAVCANLVMVELPTDGSARKARFVHFSVQEFLLAHSVGPDKQWSTGVELVVEPQTANAEITTMCIIFLLHCGDHEDGSHLYPQPINYTIRCWMLHAHALKSISVELRDLILSLFDSGFLFTQEGFSSYEDQTGVKFSYFSQIDTQFGSLLNLALVYELPLLVEHLTKTNDPPIYLPTTMHLAAKLNASKAIESLCSGNYDVNALDEDGCTPLFYAGGKEACQALLRHGADIHIEGGNFGSPLQAAAFDGREAVVKCLVEGGIDVNGFGGVHGRALTSAALRGHKGIVKFLLERGADVNGEGGEYGCALQAASCRGLLEVVKILLAHGADVNAKSGQYGHALQASSAGRELSVVQLLLEHGADVNANGGEYGSALEAASHGGQLEIVELLLANGADPNAEGGDYGSPLHAASGHQKIVEVLLARGANVNVNGGRYGSVLQTASRRGSLKVVELLLAHGADVNAGGGYYGSALLAASAQGKLSIVELLVAHGADVNLQDERHGSALQLAARRGSEEIVKLLLEKGADVKAEGGTHGYALQAASFGGSLAVVELLLAHGADIATRGGQYGYALHAASASSKVRLSLVQFLVAQGTDVNAEGGMYGFALQAAAYNGSLAVLEFLLAQGANVNAKGGEYGSALQAVAASPKEQLPLAQILVAQGANVNAEGGKYGFALHAAAASADGSPGLIKYLLAEGADVNANSGRDGSALQAAARKGNKEAVEILLANGANVNAQGGKYGSALKAASSKEYPDIVSILMDHGAHCMPETETEGLSLATLRVQGGDTEANSIQHADDAECEKTKQTNFLPKPFKLREEANLLPAAEPLPA